MGYTNAGPMTAVSQAFESLRISRGWCRVVEKWVGPTVVAFALLIAWEFAASNSTSPFVAAPSAIGPRIITSYFGGRAGTMWLGGPGWQDLVPSLARAAGGWSLAAVGGMAAGLAIGSIPRLEAASSPIINLSRSLPTPALIGVFFFLFGTGDLPKVLLIAFGAVWPVLFNAVDGARSLGTTRRHVGSIYRIPRRIWIFRILLPGALPKIFAGLRVSLSYALILMIITELQKAVNGMGYRLNLVQRSFDYTGLWTILVVLAIVGVITNALLLAVQHRVLRWHERAHR